MCVGHTQMILNRLGYEYGRLLERRAKKKGKEVKKFDNLELPASCPSSTTCMWPPLSLCWPISPC